jgi:GNAT superfamily N-acetyltransferase
MDAPEIRELAPQALDDALVLSTTAGWNQRLEDWRVLLALAPHGCFAAWHEGRVVGTAIGIDYGAFGWIAMMLVDPAWRGRGLGRRLLEAAMQAIPSDRPVRLDATPLGRPLYQSAGFEDEATITRMVRPPGGYADGQAQAGSVRPMRPADLAGIAATDVRVFGGGRRPVLQWALDTAPDYAWIRDGDPPEYCFGRHGRLFEQIGPIVAGDASTAQALAAVALGAAADQAVTVDAVDAHPEFAAWLSARAFAPQRPLFRMRRPATTPGEATFSHPPNPITEWAIFGPEFA